MFYDFLLVTIATVPALIVGIGFPQKLIDDQEEFSANTGSWEIAVGEKYGSGKNSNSV